MGQEMGKLRVLDGTFSGYSFHVRTVDVWRRVQVLTNYRYHQSYSLKPLTYASSLQFKLQVINYNILWCTLFGC